MDKSYVTLTVCPICEKETGNLLLDRRLRPTFEMHTVTPKPCKACAKKYLTKGIMLLSESGNVIVLKTSAFQRLFPGKSVKQRIYICDQAVLDTIRHDTIKTK